VFTDTAIYKIKIIISIKYASTIILNLLRSETFIPEKALIVLL